jgi:hypothetical protein
LQTTSATIIHGSAAAAAESGIAGERATSGRASRGFPERSGGQGRFSPAPHMILGTADMEQPPSSRPRIVSIVGWVWLVLAGLRFVNGLLGLVVWKIGGVDRLPFLRFQSENLKVRMAGMATFMDHAVPILVTQIVIAGAVAWAAFELLRMKRWARTAIQAAAGLGVLATVGIAVYVYIATSSISGFEAAEAAEIRVAGIASAALITVLGVAFFGITIWILGRPAVRRAFEQAP